ncbi:hypothetical protein D3C72_2262540 [compost metagenome]
MLDKMHDPAEGLEKIVEPRARNAEFPPQHLATEFRVEQPALYQLPRPFEKDVGDRPLGRFDMVGGW